jgi:hypothetical protein
MTTANDTQPRTQTRSCARIGSAVQQPEAIITGRFQLLADTHTPYFRTHSHHREFTGPMIHGLHLLFEGSTTSSRPPSTSLLSAFPPSTRSRRPAPASSRLREHRPTECTPADGPNLTGSQPVPARLGCRASST